MNNGTITKSWIVAVLLPFSMVLAFAFNMLWAMVLQDLWRWFVEPLFGLPHLPFWNAFGLVLIVGIVRAGLERATPLPEHSAVLMKVLSNGLVRPLVSALFIWGCGALAAGWAQ